MKITLVLVIKTKEKRSLKFICARSLEEFCDLVDFEVLAGDRELANALSDDRLLALFLKVELDLILCTCLNLLGTMLFAKCLNLCDIKERGLSKKTQDEVFSNENYTLLLLLDLLSKLGKEGEIDSGISLI